MDEGGEWTNEKRADLRSGRRMKLQFQGGGAHRWIFERGNGLAREIYNRSVAGNRLSGKQISAEAQWLLNAPISGGGYSTNQLFLDPTRGIFLDGMAGAKIRFSTRTPHFRGSLYNSGKCA